MLKRLKLNLKTGLIMIDNSTDERCSGETTEYRSEYHLKKIEDDRDVQDNVFFADGSQRCSLESVPHISHKTAVKRYSPRNHKLRSKLLIRLSQKISDTFQ